MKFSPDFPNPKKADSQQGQRSDKRFCGKPSKFHLRIPARSINPSRYLNPGGKPPHRNNNNSIPGAKKGLTFAATRTPHTNGKVFAFRTLIYSCHAYFPLLFSAGSQAGPKKSARQFRGFPNRPSPRWGRRCRGVWRPGEKGFLGQTLMIRKWVEPTENRRQELARVHPSFGTSSVEETWVGGILSTFTPANLFIFEVFGVI